MSQQTLKELLEELNACSDAIEWAGDKPIEEAVDQCYRGDWLLWLAKKVDIGLQPLTLAKGHCANTVRHLMKDERSIKAVDAAIAFGEGRATLDELRAAYVAADAAADAATAYAYADAATAAYAAADAADAYADAYAADAAYAAAYAYAYADAATAYAADAAYAAAYAYADAATYAADAAYAAKKENQMLTADICRKYIGRFIIDKVNEMLKTNKLWHNKH